MSNAAAEIVPSAPPPSAGKLYHSGLQPVAAYGVEVTGASPSLIGLLRRRHRQAHGVSSCGRRGPVMTAVLQKDSGVLQGAPLFWYHREWWLATDARITNPASLTPPQLVAVLEDARAAYDSGASWRKAVQGPISGAMWACSLVGWEFLSATVIRTDEEDVGSSCSPPVPWCRSAAGR